MKRRHKRIDSHSRVTPEFTSEARKVRAAEDAYFESEAGQKQLLEWKQDSDRQHGGRRPGAGRKPVERKRVTKSIRVDPDVAEFLNTLDGFGLWIEERIKRSKEFRTWYKQQ